MRLIKLVHACVRLDKPDEEVPVLLLPVSAPWLKTAEMIDYVREIKPSRGFAIHDALLSEKGLSVLGNWMNLAAGPVGADLSRLEPGTGVDL